MEKLRIGVIFGGKSEEREVSLATGRYVFSLLDKSKYTGLPIFMDPKGQIWEIPEILIIQNSTKDVIGRLVKEAKKIHFEDLQKKIDLMFIALLGKYGEDGCIQGIMELLKIPYTGSGVLASALGMDKKFHRILLESSGFKIAKGLVIGKNEWNTEKKEIINKIIEEIKLPCVIKPTREGSSIGVSVVKKKENIKKAVDEAFKSDRDILIEEYLKGMEFTCVVWGNDNPVALLPTEVVYTGDFFDYESKYMPGKAQTITPARLPDEKIKEIQKTAEEVYKLVGIKGYGRVDGFIVGKDIYISEPHTGTIMVPSSFVFQQAAQYRIELKDEFRGGKKFSTSLNPKLLITKIIEEAEKAHNDKKGPL